jgi:hypothetical protein
MRRRCQRCARARSKLLSLFIVLLVANAALKNQFSLPLNTTQNVLLIPSLVTALYAVITALRMRRGEG